MVCVCMPVDCALAPIMLLTDLAAHAFVAVCCRSETLDGLEIVFLHLTLPKLMTYKMADKLPVLAE